MFNSFTIKSANEILPIVIEKFNNALKEKNNIQKIEKELQISLSSINSFEKYVNLKQRLNSQITKFYQAVEDLENTGVVLKSLENGLLDFPSKRFDDEVWLCWKKGETVIKFWHEKDVGFMGRKPISVSDDSLV